MCRQSGVILSRQVLSRQSSVLCMAGGAITGTHGSRLSVPRWQVRSSSTPCAASRSGLGSLLARQGRSGLGSLRALQVGSVSRSRGGTILALGQACRKRSSCSQPVVGMVRSSWVAVRCQRQVGFVGRWSSSGRLVGRRNGQLSGLSGSLSSGGLETGRTPGGERSRCWIVGVSLAGQI